MTATAVPASPLCRVNSAYWLQHDIAPDGVCRRCQMRFGGWSKQTVGAGQSSVINLDATSYEDSLMEVR